MKKQYFVTALAIMIGIFSGYGLVETSRLAFDFGSDFLNGDRTFSIGALSNLGGPTYDLKVTEAAEAESVNESDYSEQPENEEVVENEISYTTTYSNYGRIDSDYNFPNITADKFLIADIETGEVLELTNKLTRNEKEFIRNHPQPIASVTKLMTALVVTENMDLDDVVTVTSQAVATYGKQGSLYAGQKLSVRDLMHALLLQSSNDAAEALAIYYGRSDFMKLMNDRADSLGMDNTFYNDPSGLSAKNVSSVTDLMTLAEYLYKEYPEIIEITDLKSYRSDTGVLWYNNSKFRNDKNYLGGKNGYTDEAKNTLVSIFELPLGPDSETRKIVVIILGSDGAEKDMRAIVYYLLKNVEYVAE